MKKLSFVFIGLILTLLTITAFSAAKDKEYAEIIFPANKNIDFKKGSIEVWAEDEHTMGEYMSQEAASAMAFMPYFNIYYNDAFSSKKKKKKIDPFYFNLIKGTGGEHQWYGMGSSFFIGKKNPNQNLVVMSTQIKPKAGEWHYYAVTWELKGKEFHTNLYYDGKVVNNIIFDADFKAMPKKLKDFMLMIGGRNRCIGEIESIKISKIAKTPEQIAEAAKGALKKDKDTLFFLNGKLMEKLKTSKKPFFDKKTPRKGMIYGPHEFVQGKHGKAMKFYEGTIIFD